MSLMRKILVGAVVGILVIGVIQNISLRHNVNRADKEKQKILQEKIAQSRYYEDLLDKERQKILEEREYFLLKRRSLEKELLYKDSLFDRIRIEYDEKINNIRNTGIVGTNKLLTDRLREISDH